MIYHLPGQSSYDGTIAAFCFATEADAAAAGYRPRRSGGIHAHTARVETEPEPENTEQSAGTAPTTGTPPAAGSGFPGTGEQSGPAEGDDLPRRAWEAQRGAAGTVLERDDAQGADLGAPADPANVPGVQGWVRGDGSHECPQGYPIKGNASSMIYHLPGESSYDATVPEMCFATAADAEAEGYRPRKR
jgi:hypothetical protein